MRHAIENLSLLGGLFIVFLALQTYSRFWALIYLGLVLTLFGIIMALANTGR